MKTIVITTIQPKTAAVLAYEKMDEWTVVLVGDKKTMPLESPHFLPFNSQQELGFGVTKYLPTNHYTRKNIGYLYALRFGSDVIYDTDDDNLPYDHWGIQKFENNLRLGDVEYPNVYKYFSSQLIWPRGLPLDEIHSLDTDLIIQKVPSERIGVWQGLADIDPDVDAIYRLVNSAPCVFDKKPSIHLRKFSYSPFNSQNTTWNLKIFPLMYLPSTVSFRFTDILRGYVAQRIMWEYDYLLGFHNATVYQERNAHNLMKDFIDEIVCYTDIKRLVNILNSLSLGNGITQDLLDVYVNLTKEGFTTTKEIRSVEAWLTDIESIKNAKD